MVSVTDAIEEAHERAEFEDEDLELAPDVAPADYFTVSDEEKAAWVVNRWLSFDEQAKRLEEQYLRMAEALERRREAFRERFEAELAEWARKQLEGGRRRSLDLLTGRVGFRSKPGGPVVKDATKAIGWAKDAAPELVTTETKVVETLDKNAAKARVAEILDKARAAVREAWEAAPQAEGEDPPELTEDVIERAIREALPPGFEYEPARDRFYVDPPKK